MKLTSIIGFADTYSNLSQKIRVMTEGWVNRRTKVLPQFVEVHWRGLAQLTRSTSMC